MLRNFEPMTLRIMGRCSTTELQETRGMLGHILRSYMTPVPGIKLPIQFNLRLNCVVQNPISVNMTVIGGLN